MRQDYFSTQYDYTGAHLFHLRDFHPRLYELRRTPIAAFGNPSRGIVVEPCSTVSLQRYEPWLHEHPLLRYLGF